MGSRKKRILKSAAKGGGVGAALGGLAGAALGATALANIWNPLGWGIIGAGIGAAYGGYRAGKRAAEFRKNPMEDTYRGWDNTQGSTAQSSFGPVQVNRTIRGDKAPRITTRAEDYGGEDVSDKYASQFGALTTHGRRNASKILNRDPTEMSDKERRAAAQIEGQFNVSEEYRKQGASKLGRGAMRLVQSGLATMREVPKFFKFVGSADEGRKQVGRIQDAREGRQESRDNPLTREDHSLIGALSDDDTGDYSSDEDIRSGKPTFKKQKRNYSRKHNV